MNPAKIFSDFFFGGNFAGFFFGALFGKYGWVQAGSLLSKGPFGSHPDIIGRSRPINLTSGSWDLDLTGGAWEVLEWIRQESVFMIFS